MTKYLSDKICAEPETKIVKYCVDHNLEFNDVTARKITMTACKDEAIYKISYNRDGKPIQTDITADVAWEYSGSKSAIERVQNKIACLKHNQQEKTFVANIEADRLSSKPDLNALVDGLYPFNIVDGKSYLTVVYYLMQVKETRNKEFPKKRKSQRIALFLSGVQGNGKSTFAESLMYIESNYGLICYVNDAEEFTYRFEENLWKSHMAFCDEVVPRNISLSRLIRAIDGGKFQLERKNQNPYYWDVNTNLIFASNESISLKQRRISTVQFGYPCKKVLPSEFFINNLKKVMDIVHFLLLIKSYIL